MNVPNHEKKAFRDMTPEERSAIVEAKLRGDVQAFNDAEEAMQWRDAESGYIRLATIYRTRPRQLVIPWEHIKPEYKWAAMDECGDVAVYDAKPVISDDAWLCGMNGHGISFELHAININTAGIDWRESLTARPEGCDVGIDGCHN